MGSPSRNVQYHPPRLSEDRLNLPQPHSPSLPTHCSGKSGMRPWFPVAGPAARRPAGRGRRGDQPLPRPRLRRTRRPAGTRQLLARATEGRRARRLEARPSRPQPRPPGQHRTGPVDPRRGPAGARRPGRADRHYHRGRPPRVRHLRGVGRVRAGTDPRRTLAGLKAARARGRKGGRKFALSKAQVRLAQAAMAHRATSVSELCRELGIRPVTLYRYVGPQGQLREQGEKVLAT